MIRFRVGLEIIYLPSQEGNLRNSTISYKKRAAIATPYLTNY